MKTLQLQEPIPRGGLGRWLNDTELKLLKKANTKISDSRIRIKRIDKDDDSYGVVIGLKRYAWKEVEPLMIGVVKRGKECHNKYDITYNQGLECCYGDEIATVSKNKRRNPARSHDE